MDEDPIKQLQALLTDRSKLLERISSIHSALGSAEDKPQEPTAERSQPVSAAPTSDVEYAIKADQVYGRVLQALRDMQAQIEQRIQPAIHLMMEAEVEQLRDQSGQQQRALKQCLAQIDQSILDCLSRLDEYQQRRSGLDQLNSRLTQLGAGAASIPEPINRQDITQVINQRIELLKQRGKL